MKNKTFNWVTDRSYDRTKAPDLSGVGWIIFRTKTGKRLACWCWEISQMADSYRAEMLGLCAIHLFARAISEYYKINNWEITMNCDNLGALNCSSYHRHRIKPSAKCTDINNNNNNLLSNIQGYLLSIQTIQFLPLWGGCPHEVFTRRES